MRPETPDVGTGDQKSAVQSQIQKERIYEVHRQKNEMNGFLFLATIIPPVSVVLNLFYGLVKKYLKINIQATKKMKTTLRNFIFGMNKPPA